MHDLVSTELTGFAWPSPAYVFGLVVFGVIGYGAWRYGRKRGDRPTLWIGVALMLYPYAVSNTLLLYAIGVALCGGIWFVHRR